MVYVGNGEVIHCAAANNQPGLRRDNISTSKYAGYDYVYRLQEGALKDIKDPFSGGEFMPSSSNSNSNSSNMSNFYYNGIPNGKYSVQKNTIFSRIIEGIGDVFGFFIGLIPNVIRMVFIGWTAIAEGLITFTVKSITGEDKLETVSVTSTEIDSSDNITIEKIVFNQIGAFDVNFFNYNEKKDK